MAHKCPVCGAFCTCNGDIDDLCLGFEDDVMACTHCDDEYDECLEGEGVTNERICRNCKYVGAIVGKDGLVCGHTREFKETDLKNTCDNFELDAEYAIYVKEERHENYKNDKPTQKGLLGRF